MNTIKSNQILTARSIGDYNCIFELQVIERKGNFATVKDMGNIKRIKIRLDSEGNECLRPDNYSMAPTYRAIK
jgi:hypothetical protein